MNRTRVTRLRRRRRFASAAALVLLLLTTSAIGSARAHGATSPPQLALIGEGSYDPMAELTVTSAWHDGLFNSTPNGTVNVHYTPLGDLQGQLALMDGTADFIISGVPFQATNQPELPGGKVHFIAAPVMASAAGFVLNPPDIPGAQGFEVNKYDAADQSYDLPNIQYGPNSFVNGSPLAPGAIAPPCPSTGCPQVNVPTVNLAAMLSTYQGTTTTTYQGNSYTFAADAWANPQVLSTWDQTALDYDPSPLPSQGDFITPGANPQVFLRSDPNDENYYLEQWFEKQAPTEWNFSGSATEALPLNDFRPYLEPGLQSELDVYQADIAASNNGTITVGPPSSLFDVYQYQQGLKQAAFAVSEWIGVANDLGEYVTPTPQAVEAGVAAGAQAGESACSATDQNALYAADHPVSGAYPLSWVDCMYVPATGLSIAKTNALAGWIRYLATDGQSALQSHGDAPLPTAYVLQALAAANQVVTSNCPGSGGVVVTDSTVPEYGTDSPGVVDLGPLEQCDPAPTPPSTTTSTVQGTGGGASANSTTAGTSATLFSSTPSAGAGSSSGSGSLSSAQGSSQLASSQSGSTSLAGGSASPGSGGGSGRSGQRRPASITASLASNLPFSSGGSPGVDKLSALVLGALLFLLARAVVRRLTGSLRS